MAHCQHINFEKELNSSTYLELKEQDTFQDVFPRRRSMSEPSETSKTSVTEEEGTDKPHTREGSDGADIGTHKP